MKNLNKFINNIKLYNIEYLMCINLNIKLIEIDGRNFRGKKFKKLILEIIAAIKLGDVNVYCKT